MKKIIFLAITVISLFSFIACEDPTERRIRELDAAIDSLDAQIAAKQNEINDVQERFDRIDRMREELGY